jgi:hypothetical protein
VDPDYLVRREKELTEIISHVLSEMQVTLIYEQELPKDYSLAVETLDSICEAVYQEGRNLLDEMEENDVYAELEPERADLEKPEKVIIDEGNGEWIKIGDAGAESDVVEEHFQNIHRSEMSYEGMPSGAELRRWLEMYEELREKARYQNVYAFEPIDERLLDKEFGGEQVVEGEDAEVLR